MVPEVARVVSRDGDRQGELALRRRVVSGRTGGEAGALTIDLPPTPASSPVSPALYRGTRNAHSGSRIGSIMLGLSGESANSTLSTDSSSWEMISRPTVSSIGSDWTSNGKSAKSKSARKTPWIVSRKPTLAGSLSLRGWRVR